METAAVAPAAQSYPFTRWAALGGVLYVPMFVIGVILLFSNEPASDAPPAKFTSWYGNSGHRDRIMIGWLVAGLGIFFLLWFVGALRRAVTAVDGEGLLAQITGMGGAIYVAVAWVALALNAGIRTMSDDTYRHQVDPLLMHAADDASWVIHATGVAGLSAMIIAASIAFMRGRVWPTWAGWLSVVAGVLSLAAIVFFPQFLYLLWILIVSGLLFLRPLGMRTA